MQRRDTVSSIDTILANIAGSMTKVTLFSRQNYWDAFMSIFRPRTYNI